MVIDRVLDFDLELILPVLGIGVVSLAIVILTEVASRAGLVNGELARKSTHFGIGLTLLISLEIWGMDVYRPALVCAVIATLVLWPLRILRSMRDVQRKTIGHLLYPVGLLIAALLFDSARANQVGLLHLFLADTLAALLGKHWRSPILIKVGHSQKTLIGSTVFWISSAVIFLTYYLQTDLSVSLVLIASLAAANIMTASEALGFWGLDNLYIPALAASLVL